MAGETLEILDILRRSVKGSFDTHFTTSGPSPPDKPAITTIFDASFAPARDCSVSPKLWSLHEQPALVC
jgi:hypothetical protein